MKVPSRNIISKKKKIIILGRQYILLAVVLLAVAAVFFGRLAGQVGRESAPKDIISAVFLATGAEFSEMRLVGWSLYAEHFMRKEEMQAAAAAIAAQLMLTDISEMSEEEEHWRSYTVRGKGTACEYQILLQTLPGEAFLLVSCYAKDSLESFTVLNENLQLLVAQTARTEEGDVNSLLIGSIEGRLSYAEAEKRSAAAFAAAGVRLIEKANESNYFSVTGYAEALSDFVVSGNNRVNIQIAFDYNERSDKTYVYLGHPLIFDDF